MGDPIIDEINMRLDRLENTRPVVSMPAQTKPDEQQAPPACRGEIELANGVYPTMITPFKPDTMEVDWRRLDALTEWYIQSGCTGLFAVCLSSEMYYLSPEECLQVAERVYTKAAGRVTVVASGTLGGTIEEQAQFVNKMSQFCEAVVVVVCQMCTEEEDEQEWMRNTSRLLELTPGVNLGLYECPVPYWRLLSPQALAWAASTGRFLFHKDTCCSTSGIQNKLECIPRDTQFKFYNANVETLLFSLQQGGHGFCGISANFYPWLHVALCKLPTESKEAQKIQRFISVFENVVTMVYPRSAKVFLALWKDFQVAPDCRKPGMRPHDEVELIKLHDMHAMMMELCAELRIKPLDPSTFL